MKRFWKRRQRDEASRVEGVAHELHDIGNRLYQQHRYGEAEDAYRAAIDAGDPRHSVAAMNSLGNMLSEQDRYDEAETMLLRAVETEEPDVAPAALDRWALRPLQRHCPH